MIGPHYIVDAAGSGFFPEIYSGAAINTGTAVGVIVGLAVGMALMRFFK